MPDLDWLVGKKVSNVTTNKKKYRQRTFPGNDLTRTTGIVITFSDGSELKIRPESGDLGGEVVEFLVIS